MIDKTLVAARGNFHQEVITDRGDDNKVVIHSVQNVAPILEYIKTKREFTPSRNMREVAEIPMVVYQRLCRLGIADDPAAMKKWLNDPDNKAFRIAKGKV